MTRSKPRIGPGTLMLIVGPSGAGKDTLINLMRAKCTSDETIVFPRRAVTRPPSEHEDHDSLTEAEFEARARDGGFALSWDAHGLRYGVSREINRDIGQGKTVVCNVSRSIIADARRRYAHCLVVLVTAPEEVLRQRLLGRNRSTDGALSERLERGAPAGLVPDMTVENVGEPELIAAGLLASIMRDRQMIK
jgi:ribose 1,5-bisphosphokinase